MKKLTVDDFLIDGSASVRDAMRRLDKNATRILFVTGDGNKLIGSLSDGDIRRWLLQNGPLEGFVRDASYKKTISLDTSANREDVEKEMARKAILFVPVLDEHGIVVDILSRDADSPTVIAQSMDLLGLPVVVMAGGKGTRMQPFTNVLPKPLIPIGEKTILEIILSEYRRFGIEDFFFVTNYRGGMIRAYFDSIEKDYKVTYINEEEFRGTAGGLYMLRGSFESAFVVTNCDIIVKADFLDVMNFHKSSGAMLTVLSSLHHQQIPYGIIKYSDGGRVSFLEEKPEISYCVNTGVYILEPSCLDYIPPNGNFHMTDLIEVLMKDGKPVFTYPISERDYQDIGQWDEYHKTLAKMS